MFRETATGAQTDGTKLRKALAVLEAGDVLMVTQPDLLARRRRRNRCTDCLSGNGSRRNLSVARERTKLARN